MKTAVALGTFDGVHKGHLSVINAAVSSGFRPIAVAFPEPPKSIISGDKKLLMTPYKKKQMLENQGITEVFYLDFLKIRDNSPEEFLRFLKNEFNPAVICYGFNYHFGKNGAGDVGFIAEFCKKNGIEFIKAEPVEKDGITVSSTYIRGLLEEGRVTEANSLLSEPFGFSAQVIHGDKRGRTIGFPTVNQLYPDNLVRVKFGVYKSLVTVSGKTYNSITNIGVRPTFQNGKISAETHIIGFSGDIYGEVAEIKLTDFLREERKFSSLDELKENIILDIEKAH